LQDYKTYNDLEIIDGIKRNEDNAYKAIFYNRTNSIRKFILKNSGDEEDAKEIEQKTILILFKKIRDNNFELKQGVKLSTFLFSIAKNLWYKDLKKKNKSVSLDLNPDHMDIQLPELDITIRDEKEALLLNELESLSERCRTILHSRYFLKISYQRIATVLGDTTPDNARKNKAKCMKKLKEKMLQKINSYG